MKDILKTDDTETRLAHWKLFVIIQSVKFLLQSFDGPNTGLLESPSIKAFITQVPQINIFCFHKYSFLNECYTLCLRKYICIQRHFWVGNQALTPPPQPAYLPSLTVSVPENEGRGCRRKASLQMASLTWPAAFPSLPKSSKDLRPS